jgi:hypothetical protein
LAPRHDEKASPALFQSEQTEIRSLTRGQNFRVSARNRTKEAAFEHRAVKPILSLTVGKNVCGKGVYAAE